MTWSEIVRSARGELTQIEAAKVLSGPTKAEACSVGNIRNWEQGLREPPKWMQWQIVGTLLRARVKK